jgi:hypothetical protein
LTAPDYGIQGEIIMPASSEDLLDMMQPINDNRNKAKRVAKEIPLVHVIRTKHFLEVVKSPLLMLSITQEGRSSPKTIKAEDTLGLGRCLYFYAGRACPEFGEIALAFDAQCEEEHSGWATPFDTGGLAAQKIRWNLPDQNDERIRDFTMKSRVPLEQWRERFASFLETYFPDLSTYWFSRPCQADPEEIYILNDDWRAWVFEVRFQEPHDACNRIALCTSFAISQMLRREYAGSPIRKDILDKPERITSYDGEAVCDTIEEWIKERLGL